MPVQTPFPMRAHRKDITQDNITYTVDASMQKSSPWSRAGINARLSTNSSSAHATPAADGNPRTYHTELVKQKKELKRVAVCGVVWCDVGKILWRGDKKKKLVKSEDR